MLNGRWPHGLSTWNWVRNAIIIRDGRFGLHSVLHFQPGEGSSRGLLRAYEPSDGTFSSTTYYGHFNHRRYQLPGHLSSVLSCRSRWTSVESRMVWMDTEYSFSFNSVIMKQIRDPIKCNDLLYKICNLYVNILRSYFSRHAWVNNCYILILFLYGLIAYYIWNTIFLVLWTNNHSLDAEYCRMHLGFVASIDPLVKINRPI